MEISELVGKTIDTIVGGVGDERITFTCSDGTEYAMFHSQDCCERVQVEDICGDLADLIGSPVVQAEESTNAEDRTLDGSGTKATDDDFLWTFYRVATARGTVVIRWLGESNGYYSVRVDFEQI